MKKLCCLAIAFLLSPLANGAITYTECVANFSNGTVAAIMNTNNAQDCNIKARQCAQSYSVGFASSQYYTFPGGGPQKVGIDWSQQGGKIQTCSGGNVPVINPSPNPANNRSNNRARNVPSEFWFYYSFDPKPNWRQWTRIDHNLWTELYPNGNIGKHYVLSADTNHDGCRGTIVSPNDGAMEIFIPDIGCPNMPVTFRWNKGDWGLLERVNIGKHPPQ